MSDGNDEHTATSRPPGGPVQGSGAGFWIAAALVLLIAVYASFGPALDASFVNWDDESNLVDNEAFRGLSAEHLEWMFTHPEGGPYMPLTWLSLAVDHALWGLGEGLEAPEAPLFHRTSVLLHALTALAFLALAQHLLAGLHSTASARARGLAALLAALLFAVHPLRVESVAWVTERRDVLSGLFFVLAIYAWLRAAPRARAPQLRAGPALFVALASCAAPLLWLASVDLSGELLSWRGPGLSGFAAGVVVLLMGTLVSARAAHIEHAPRRGLWLLLAVLMVATSFLSKALGVTLPLVLLVLDVWPLQRLRRSSALALLVEKLPLLALSVTFGVLAMWGQAQYAETFMSWEHHTLSERLLQAAYGLFYYPTRTLVPVHLIPFVQLPQDLALLDPRFLIASVCVVGTAAVLVLRRRRAPAALVAGLTFALLIGPVLGLSQAGGQLVADRYSYLACMPFALLAAGGWLAWYSRSRSALAPLGVAALVCLTSAALTWRQTAHWRNSDALWEHMAEVEPTSGLPHMLLGMLRYREGQEAPAGEMDQLLEQAREHFARGFAIEAAPIPHYMLPYGALLIDLQRIDEARPVLERYIAARPQDPIGHTNLGVVYARLGRPRAAIAQLELAVQLDPEYPKAWMLLGLAYETAALNREARGAFERVLSFWPRYRPARQRLRSLQGRSDGAAAPRADPR